MNKKTYIAPHLTVMELNTCASLLLPASGGQTTDESLSRGFDNEFDEDMTNKSRRRSTYNAWNEDEGLEDEDF